MKKTVQKGILIAMCYYFVVLINACCHCEIPQKILLSTEGIRLQNIEMIFEGDSNYYFNPIYADSIAQNKYGIQIQFDMKEIVQSSKTSFGFVSSATACKCQSDNFFSKDSLSNITIRTLQNFDASHPSGTDISSYFCAFSYVQSKFKKKTIEEYLLIRANQYYSPYYNIELYLQQLPEPKNKPIQFELSCSYTNGKVIKDTTNLVRLY